MQSILCKNIIYFFGFKSNWLKVIETHQIEPLDLTSIQIEIEYTPTRISMKRFQ